MAQAVGAPSTVSELLARGAARLRQAGVEQPPTEARLLFELASGINRTELIARPERTIAAEIASRYSTLLARREAREPFAQIVGRREFYGLSFTLDRHVLIPRPETELLVQRSLVVLAELRAAGVCKPWVVDVGTGSGAIACSVSKHAPWANVVAVDISREALNVAAANAKQLGVSRRIRVVRGSLVEAMSAGIHVIIANLPYLTTDSIPSLQPEIARYEPRLALDGGVDGLDLVRPLIGQAERVLAPGGKLLLELDPDQIEKLSSGLAWSGRRVLRDLAGLDRVLELERA